MREAVQWRTDSAGRRYRAVRTVPSGRPLGTVVLAGPGSVAALGGAGEDDLLLRRLTDRLLGRGLQVLGCDMPSCEPGRPTDAPDVEARAERLDGVLRGSAHLPRGPLTLVGFSLGAEALLHLLEAGRVPRVAALVLVGLVLEAPVFLSSPVDQVHLVYGGLDLVGYVPADGPDASGPGSVSTTGPEVYGASTARRLITRLAGSAGVRILPGLGHTLRPRTRAPAPDPAALLAELAATPAGAALLQPTSAQHGRTT